LNTPPRWSKEPGMSAAAPHVTVGIDRAVLLTRLFIEALNARDVDGLARLVSDDVEFRRAGGPVLRGRQALERIVRAAADAKLRLSRRDAEAVAAGEGCVIVTVPVVELIGSSEVDGTAIFEVTDDRITGFEVRSKVFGP
jgi:hypothetical protein